MNLYEIHHEIMSCWDEETGEVLDVQKFDAMQMALEDKLEGIGCYIKNLEAEAAALKLEEQAFAARRKRAENKAASLKNYLSGYLQGCPFETLRVKISFRKSESLELSETAVVPEEFLKYTVDVNKAELKKAVKAGLVLDGVQLVQKNNINIK